MTTKIAPAPGHQLPPFFMGDIRSTRACDYCRNLKVRCISGNVSSAKCQRCAKSQRDCIMTAPQKRKQRKRTGTRVAELEREVRVMQAAFSQKEGTSHQALPEEETTQTHHPSQAPPASNSPSGTTQAWGTSGLGQSFSTCEVLSSTIAQPATPFSVMNADVVDRGLLSDASATQLFDTYVNHLVPHYPLVVFPEGYTAQELRHSRPTLFLAVIAAASGKSNPELSTLLNTEVLQAYATRTLINSEKSLELVQAMIITSVWYNPPNDFRTLKFYEYIHMAATMALDIGLGTKPDVLQGEHYSSRNRTSPELGYTTLSSTSTEPDTAGIEDMRTFLACYLMCAGVSVSMRRSNMLRFSNWTNECMEWLKSSSCAAPSDRSLVAWVRLVKIAEEIGTLLSYDDTANIPTLSNPRGNLLLKNFEKELRSWRRETSSDIVNGSIEIVLHHTNIYLHEIALHADHAPRDFTPPYQVEHLRLSNAQPTTAACMDSITECITSAQSLIDSFLSMDIDALESVPIFTYVRLSYALFVLAKLHVSANIAPSQLGDYIDRESLKIGPCLDATVNCLAKVVERRGCKVPSIFSRLLINFQTWYKLLDAQGELAKGKDKHSMQTDDLDLPSDQKPGEAAGSLKNSEYMLMGSYSFAGASQDLEEPKRASTVQQGRTGIPKWNASASTGGANILQGLDVPNAAVFTGSIHPDMGQFGLPDDFQYNSAAAFDNQMGFDLDFFSLFGAPNHAGGEPGEWVLPKSSVGDPSNDQMPGIDV